MALIGDLTATLALDAADFLAGTRTAQKALGGLSGTVNAFAKRMATGLGVRLVASALGGPLVTAATAASIAVGGVATSLGLMESVASAASRQITTIAFETIVGDAKVAREALADLIDFANRTPFSNDEILGSARQLLAYGFGAQGVAGELRMLGEVAAGLDVPLSQIVRAYGQVRSAQRLTGQEALQLVNAGFPIWEGLSQRLGVTTDRVREMVSEGQIGFPVVQQLFRDLTSEGGLFNGLLDKTSEAYLGLWSTLRGVTSELATTVGNTFLRLGESILRVFVNAASAANDLAGVVLMPLKWAFGELAEGIDGALWALDGFYQAAKYTLGRLAQGFTEAGGLVQDWVLLLSGENLGPLAGDVDATTQATEELAQASANAGKQLDALQGKLDQVTKTPLELFQQSAGPGEVVTKEQIDKFVSLTEQITAAEQAQKALQTTQAANGNAISRIRELELEYSVLTGAITESEAVRQRLLQGGAEAQYANRIADLTREMEEYRETVRQVEKATNDLRKIEQNRMREAMDAVKSIREAIKNPFEELTAELETAAQLLAEGFLTAQEFEQFLQQKRAGIGDNGQEINAQQPGALRQGSAEAYSAILEAVRKDGVQKMTAAEKKQTELTQRMVTLLERILNKDTVVVEEVKHTP